MNMPYLPRSNQKWDRFDEDKKLFSAQVVVICILGVLVILAISFIRGCV